MEPSWGFPRPTRRNKNKGVRCEQESVLLYKGRPITIKLASWRVCAFYQNHYNRRLRRQIETSPKKKRQDNSERECARLELHFWAQAAPRSTHSALSCLVFPMEFPNRCTLLAIDGAIVVGWPMLLFSVYTDSGFEKVQAPVFSGIRNLPERFVWFPDFVLAFSFIFPFYFMSLSSFHFLFLFYFFFFKLTFFLVFLSEIFKFCSWIQKNDLL